MASSSIKYRDQNEEELKLFYQDPDQLFILYTPLIQKIVNIYFPVREYDKGRREDLVHDILLKLLEKKFVFQQKFNNKCMLRTYFSSVISNYCLEYHRKFKTMIRKESEAIEAGVDISTINQLVIREALSMLRLIISTYFRDSAKILLFLKVKFGFPLNMSDLQAYFSALDDSVLQNIFESVSKPPFTSQFLYQTLNEYTNLQEGKKVSPDALRKWVDNSVHEIIQILNNQVVEYNFSQESFGILVEYYFYGFPKILADALDK